MSIYGPTKLYERLDLICVNRYGSSKNDVVIFVLENNPGLESYGIILPSGIKINLPDLPKTARTLPVAKQIFLWD